MCLSLQSTPTSKSPPSHHHSYPSLHRLLLYPWTRYLVPGAHVLAWLIRLDSRRRSVVPALPQLLACVTHSSSNSLPCASLSPTLFYRFSYSLSTFTYLHMPAAATMLAASRLLSFAAPADLLSHIHRRASALAFTGSTRMGARWVWSCVVFIPYVPVLLLVTP